VLRPQSSTRRDCIALALMLMALAALSWMRLLTITGWAPRTKIVEATFVPIPLRLVLARPPALLLITLLVTRTSAW